MIIDRLLLVQISEMMTPGKVTILYGPRQVGKTTLINALLPRLGRRYRFISADEMIYRDVLASQDRHKLGELLDGIDLLAIDEAQRVDNIGLNLKIFVDNFPEAFIIATGSASFELASKITEPLTGRALTFTLFPLSFGELKSSLGAFEARRQLERWMIWGGYPEVALTDSPLRRDRLLGELVGSSLYRDILELEGVRRSEKIVDLLRLLAFQIGRDVSIAELATNLSLGHQTVERYLDLLEKVFIIFKVRGFARNLRKEINKSARFYFYDTGVRNSLIQNFNPLSLRNDTGQLWENYMMVERRKVNQQVGRMVNTYFWRTYDQKEIDCIEEYGGKLYGYEFKWQGAIKKSTLTAFTNTYPQAEVISVNRDNFELFLQ